MKTLNLVSLAVSLALASSVYAATPDTTAPEAASSQHQRDATSGTRVAEASAEADKPDAKMIGMKVQMSSGESLGEVKEVLVDGKGDASYAVVSHGGVMGVGAKRSAIPWATVKSSRQNDKLIMDRSQLQQAPVLSGDKTPDASSGTWSREADEYWHAKAGTDSMPSPAPAPAKERT